jgi:VWA domain-containing protein
VFDISGSMGLPPIANPPPGSPYPTRMAALKDGAKAFFLNAPQQAWLGDKVGVVYFSTTATAVPGPMGGPSNMFYALDQAKMNALLTNIQGQNPTASTSIGAGLTTASNLGFKLEAAGAKKVVVLFSDGEENTDPKVDDGSGTATPKKAMMDLFDRIIPVTAGDMTAPGFLLQNNIGLAKNKSPYSFHVTTPTDLNTAYTQSMAEIFTGTDKLEMVRDATGTIAAGKTVTEKFLGNTDDTVLSILVTWSPSSIATGPVEFPEKANITLPFKLIAPDGTVIDTKGRTQSTQGMSVTTVRFPIAKTKKDLVQNKGEWSIELNASDPVMPKFKIANLNYQLIVLLDNPTLTSDFRIDAKDVGTGEAVPIRVKLAEKGKAVKNAAVVAELSGPNAGLGDVLATSKMPAGNPNIGNDKIRNDAQKKLLLLLADPANAKLFGMSGLPQLTLQDDGAGTYGAQLLSTDKEGHYRFRVVVLGKSSQGDFQRTQTLTVFARAKPSPKNSNFVRLPSENPTTMLLKVTLKDAFGRFLGPDYLSLLKVSSSEGTLLDPLTDKNDGTYEISFKLPSATSNPNITIAVGGKTVIQRPLRGVENSPPQCPDIIIYDVCPPPPRLFPLFRRWR